MATIGHALHFSYSDMLSMGTKDFIDFIDMALKILNPKGLI